MLKVRKYILLMLKGMAMGAADVVPGVSGGTIALITGIYRELVDSIKAIDLEAIRLLFNLRFSKFWEKINGTFLLFIFSGILISIFSLARILKSLLNSHPIYVWSFFFGLIIASAILVIRSVREWRVTDYLALLTGIVTMFIITRFSPAQTTEAYWFIFIAGAIAICAMILPGISGAFILLIMGKYQFILGAVSNLDLPVLLVFGLGVLSGLAGFSRVLSYLLNRYYRLTISILAGFIIGSLNKIWPWKETISERLNSHGEIVPLVQKNILPYKYYDTTGLDPHILAALLMMISAFLLVVVLDRIGKKVL
jgi:putative membrane protein